MSAGAATVRAFFALVLTDDALAEALRLLAALRRAPGAERLRFVRADGLHATLRFLGEVPRVQAAEIAGVVGSALAGQGGFSVQLGLLHPFPTPRRPRVIVLGLEPEAPLTALVAAVERGVTAAGLTPETRPFRPHVTLARVREGARLDPHLLDGLIARHDARFLASEIVLFESVLAPGGSQYVPLAHLPLAAAVPSVVHEAAPASPPHSHHS